MNSPNFASALYVIISKRPCLNNSVQITLKPPLLPPVVPPVPPPLFPLEGGEVGWVGGVVG